MLKVLEPEPVVAAERGYWKYSLPTEGMKVPLSNT